MNKEEAPPPCGCLGGAMPKSSPRCDKPKGHKGPCGQLKGRRDLRGVWCMTGHRDREATT